MSLSEALLKKKNVVIAAIVVYAVNLCGNVLLRVGDPFFRLLYYFLTIPTTLLILLLFPTVGIARQLKSRLGIGYHGALFLGLGLSAAIVPLVIFWWGRVCGFTVASVGGCVSVISVMMVVMSKVDEGVFSYGDRVLLQNRSEKWIFYLPIAVYIFLVSLAFIASGTLSWRGVAKPAIGDWMFIYGDINAIVATGIPPQNPFIVSGELIYYYFFHLYAAVFVLLSGGGLSAQSAGTLCVAVCITSVACAVFCIARHWIGSFLGALTAMLMVTYIAGWDIIGNAIVRLSGTPWPPDIDYWTNWTVFKIHCPITGFHFLPQHLFGILFFWMFFYFLTLKTEGKWLFCFLSLAAGLGYSSWAILGVVPTAAVYLALELISRARESNPGAKIVGWLREVAKIGVVAACAMIAVFPIYLGAFGGDFNHKWPIRCWRLPPLHTVAWLPATYHPPSIAFHLLGIFLMEIVEFGPLFLLGIPGLFFISRIRDDQARKMLVAIFAANFFLINCLNAGGANPGECVSKVDGYFVWWALAVLSGVFLHEKYYLEGSRMRLISRHGRHWWTICVNLLIVCGLALGFASSLYSVAGKMNFERLPAEDFIALTYMGEKIPPSSRVQRSPFCPEWSIPAWGGRLTAFNDDFSAREYLVPIPYLQKVKDGLEEAFQTHDANKAHEIFSRYGVGYVLLGTFERKRYKEPALTKFKTSPRLFSLEWEYGDVQIYRLLPVS